jgi:hypothetical protein
MVVVSSIEAFAALERTARRILDGQRGERIMPEQLREQLS